MSWDGYLSQHIVGSGLVDQAILIDQSGQSVWGKASDVELTPEEMNKIAFAFNDPTAAQESGITVGGKKYFFGWIDEPADKIPVLFCAMGKEGIIAAKCTSSILVSHFPDTVPANRAVTLITQQAKYLIDNNL
ncbi:hypothetical protein TSTA_104950 [Talaromyces stipitatus ATCC 10500]|uniref:Profilin n=1 Tax=Talaromyces stipitatus (strain ATCC 10500 / CBS 375.48 / QM 6759 / NRRL 1006) TaxID=441959 RepID=B8MP42_TALSN|nr:uncharacterized protein TSTA_104950 [Talaromyces stipitatus ATCC 10500]EED14281.1 hypothetical protein TSTA_104950 [Talaromyces stipitatus ATCC 10500]